MSTPSAVTRTAINHIAFASLTHCNAERETALSANVKTERIETLMPIGADVVSARALAELPELLGFAERHLRPDGTALFQKGTIWQKELVQARKSWSFQSEHFTSVTAPQAVILKIERIAHA